MEPLTISCDECRLSGTSACEDCVVSFLLSAEAPPRSLPGAGAVACVDPRPQSTAVIVDAAEARAMRLLHSAGLVPSLRFERRVG